MRRSRPWLFGSLLALTAALSGCQLNAKPSDSDQPPIDFNPKAIEVVPVWVSSKTALAGEEVTLDVWLNDKACGEEKDRVVATVTYGDSDVIDSVDSMVVIPDGLQSGTVKLKTKDFDTTKCKYRLIRIEIFDDNGKGTCSGTVLVRPKTVTAPR